MDGRQVVEKKVGGQGARARQRILRAAAEEFDARGYAAATFARMAERMGTTKGLITYHFPTKAGLARAVVEKAFGPNHYVGVDVLPSGVAGLDFLIQSCFEVAESFQHDVLSRAAIRLQNEHKLIEEPLPLPYLDWIRQIASSLRQAKLQGEIGGEVDEVQAAWVMVASFAGLQTVSDRLTGRSDLAERVAVWLKITLAGLGCSDGEPRIAAVYQAHMRRCAVKKRA